MARGNAPAIRTTCPYCGVGCGILAARAADGSVSVAGDPDHPANFGRLCSKGAALAETLSLEGRLLAPEIEGRPVSWDEAIGLLARRFRETIREHGPESVAFYVSGQLLTEDYYVANKLMKGYIGTANIDTNSRLCMASSVAGHRRAFGSDTVPGCYEDLELADLVLLVGSNLAWCHPVLFQRLLAAREERGTRIVVVDPRRTVTAEAADLHLPLEPGSDVALFNGLLAWLDDTGAADADYVARHTRGAEPALARARAASVTDVARATCLDAATLETFYRLVADTPRTVTVYSQGVNQSSCGTDKVNAIINCHLLTGRIGKPGTGPFSVTGQPNAMGGREVGGLANMLAAHAEIESPDDRARVQAFWNSPVIAERPGLKAVDLFRAVRDGTIKALWIMATNPVDSLPEADGVVAALEGCPFVVVSDNVRDTDTARHADVLLPAAAWGEKDGTVTNSERRISRQRQFLDLPGEARPDWWIVCRVAGAMGFDGFDYESVDQVFDEYCRLTACLDGGARGLDLSGLAGRGAEGYEAMTPVQWPVARDGESGGEAPERFFANGGFFTDDRRARFVPLSHRPPMSRTSERYPLVLNTGRIRDQWHTMTRSGRAPRLLSHMAEPFLEIHPGDAARCGVAPATLARVSSGRGEVALRVLVSDRVPPGHVFAPIHWTDQFASRARIDTLVAPHDDPLSGQPETKFTPVRVTPFAAAWYAYAVMRARPRPAGGCYWAAAPVAGGWQAELAGTEPRDDWVDFVGELAGRAIEPDECLAFHDRAAGLHRLALFEDGRLQLALFASREPVQVSRAWAVEQLSATFTPAARLQLLAGRGAAATRERGAILCACMNVGVNDVAAALAGGARTLSQIGAVTGAGTNCGSCRPEITRLLEAPPLQAAE